MKFIFKKTQTQWNKENQSMQKSCNQFHYSTKVLYTLNLLVIYFRQHYANANLFFTAFFWAIQTGAGLNLSALKGVEWGQFYTITHRWPENLSRGSHSSRSWWSPRCPCRKSACRRRRWPEAGRSYGDTGCGWMSPRRCRPSWSRPANGQDWGHDEVFSAVKEFYTMLFDTVLCNSLSQSLCTKFDKGFLFTVQIDSY